MFEFMQAVEQLARTPGGLILLCLTIITLSTAAAELTMRAAKATNFRPVRAVGAIWGLTLSPLAIVIPEVNDEFGTVLAWVTFVVCISPSLAWGIDRWRTHSKGDGGTSRQYLSKRAGSEAQD